MKHSIDDIKDMILVIDSNILKIKQEAAEAEGSIKTHMKSLKEKYDLSSEDEIIDFLDKSKKEAERTKKTIVKIFEEIVDEYESINK